MGKTLDKGSDVMSMVAKAKPGTATSEVVLQTRWSKVKTTVETLNSCESDMLDRFLQDGFKQTFDKKGRRLLKLGDFDSKVLTHTIERMASGATCTTPSLDAKFIKEQHRQLNFFLHRPTLDAGPSALKAECSQASRLKREQAEKRRQERLERYSGVIHGSKILGMAVGGVVGGVVGGIATPVYSGIVSYIASEQSRDRTKSAGKLAEWACLFAMLLPCSAAGSVCQGCEAGMVIGSGEVVQGIKIALESPASK